MRSISLKYQSFVANAGPGVADSNNRKNCQLTLAVRCVILINSLTNWAADECPHLVLQLAINLLSTILAILVDMHLTRVSRRNTRLITTVSAVVLTFCEPHDLLFSVQSSIQESTGVVNVAGPAANCKSYITSEYSTRYLR